MIAQNAFLRVAASVLLSLALLPDGARYAWAQSESSQQQSYLLGTSPTGGTYHPVGVALSTLVKLKLLPEANVDLTAINTSGSEENIGLMRRNEIEFAILSAQAGYDARQGVSEFIDVGPDENLRAITALWFKTDHLVVHKDAVRSGTVNDFLGLRGQKVSLGRNDSGTLAGNRALMASFGLDIDADFDRVELAYQESAEAFISGEIAGMSLSGGVPIKDIQTTFDALGDDAVVLEFDDDQLALIDQGRRLWGRVVIPAGTYAGQNRDIFSIGTPTILAVRADVDDEAVYQITKTIFENLDYLHGLHGTTRHINLETAGSNLPLPLHDGARRYFEEEGVELPLPQVELDPDLLVRYETPAQAREALNQSIISMFAGASVDTSTRIAHELSSLLTIGDDGFRLLPTYGGGSGQNLTDLLYLKGVDTALVRTDSIAYAGQQNVYPSIESKINYITEMFPEEVHLVVREDVTDIRDLIGKNVNIGAPGSGTDITASIILSQLDLAVETTRFDAQRALDKLQRGEIAAAFFVGGKPMPLLLDVGQESGVRLMPIPFVQYADSYRPVSLDGRDYPNLIVASDEVPTLAVRTALLTYAWRPGTERYIALETFSDALFSHLLELQRDGYHPKWREVDPTSEILGWQRFDPAITWVSDNVGTARTIASRGRELIDQQEASRPITEDTEDQPRLIRPSSLDGPVPAETATPAAETAAPANAEVPKEAAVSPTELAPEPATPLPIQETDPVQELDVSEETEQPVLIEPETQISDRSDVIKQVAPKVEIAPALAPALPNALAPSSNRTGRSEGPANKDESGFPASVIETLPAASATAPTF